MTKRVNPILGLLLVPAAVLHGQYVGKVGQGIEKKPTLRATAVYEYTGSMTAPNASRLVPVVVWDGEHYQPGGLYLSQPEPLAVAAGTQYVLEQSGVPAGLFNVGSAAELNGGWVGLGRFAANTPPPAPKRLASARKLPAVTGGSGKGKASDTADNESSGPVLHRKTGSDTGTTSTTPASPSGGTTGSTPAPSSGDGPTLHRRDADTSTTAPAPDDDRPTLHRKDSDTTDTSSTTSPANGTTPSSTPGTSDPDGPTLHRKDSGDSSTSSSQTSGQSTTTASTRDDDRPTLHKKADTTTTAPATDADRPKLHRHADDSGAEASSTPDPDRPHLRYGVPAEIAARVPPTVLKDTVTSGGVPVKVGQVVAISDTEADEPHPFRYTWPTATAQEEARSAMHDLALHALVTAAKATFGPAAQTDAALKRAEASGSTFGPAAKPLTAAARHTGSSATQKSQPDLLVDPEFAALELSYGGGVTYVYTAHTAAVGADERYVTVIAQPDFYGKPHAVFSQTTKGDMLGQTPALHLVDAVDADGDHRAELLFEAQAGMQTATTQAARAVSTRQFELYSVLNGHANQVYSSIPSAQQ